VTATERRLTTPPEQSFDEPLLLSVRDAARRLNIGRDCCYSLVREGRLRSISVGNRRLIPKAELEAFIEREQGAGT
jgi:excisionase family DNA binding protein